MCVSLEHSSGRRIASARVHDKIDSSYGNFIRGMLLELFPSIHDMVDVEG